MLSVEGQRGLRLDRDHPGAEPAERGDAVADMGADVEHQIAALDELPVQRVHRARAAALAPAVIDAQRPHHPARGSQGFEHGVMPAAPRR